jgi:hypothetical protein
MPGPSHPMEREGKSMRKLLCLFALLAFCVPLSLSASSRSSRKSFNVISPVEVQNVTLAPGRYEVTWTKMGDNVPVTILHGGKAVVTVANASVVAQPNPEGGTFNVSTAGALETAQGPNGVTMLTKLDFSDVAVILAPAGAAR